MPDDTALIREAASSVADAALHGLFSRLNVLRLLSRSNLRSNDSAPANQANQKRSGHTALLATRFSVSTWARQRASTASPPSSSNPIPLVKRA